MSMPMPPQMGEGPNFPQPNFPPQNPMMGQQPGPGMPMPPNAGMGGPMPPPGSLNPVIIAAIKDKNLPQLQSFIEGSNFNPAESDEFGWTALHYTGRLGDLEITKFLLERGSNPNQQNGIGDSPLHLASSEGHPQVALLLLQANGNPNLPNKHGNTPFHYCCHWFNANICQLMIQKGAQLVKNAFDETPFDKAPEVFQPQLQTMFMQVIKAKQGPAGGQSNVQTQQLIRQQQLMQQRIQQQQALLQKQQEMLQKQKEEAERRQHRELTESDLKRIGEIERKREKHPWEVNFDDIKREKFIGKGGFGEVWLGDWIGTKVAVKTILASKISEKNLGEFRSEVNVLSKLRHPNITLFMCACVIPPDMCIASEYMERGSLYSVLHDKKVEITWKMMVDMAIDAAKGMNYLHCFNPCIMHRDLKSLNLLVDKNWTVKITDFGLSLLVGENDVNQQCGTPQWMAPELLRNEKYDEKSDIYSFGICLWEMYTRSEPYHGMNPMQVGMKVLLEGLRPPIPRHCPAPMHALITDCWATDPKQRPDFSTILSRLYEIKEQTCQ